MSDNNGSVVDSIIVGAMFIFLIYLLILSVPIAAYLDPIMMFGFQEIKPESVFGQILTLAFVGLLPAFLILKALLWIVKDHFQNETAMYIFLYAQGFFAVSFVGISDVGILSKVLIDIMAWGFKETAEHAAIYYRILSVILLLISIFVEVTSRKTYVLSNEKY